MYKAIVYYSVVLCCGIYRLTTSCDTVVSCIRYYSCVKYIQCVSVLYGKRVI